MYKKLFVLLLAALVNCGKTSVKSAALKETVEWMGVYVSGQKIGYNYLKENAENGKFHFVQKSTMQIEMLGTNETIRMNLDAITDSSFNLEEFTFDVDSRQRRFYASGKREGSKILIEVKSAGRIKRTEVAASGDVLLVPVIAQWTMAQSPQPGDAWTVNVFEPLFLKILPVRIKAIAAENISMEDGSVIPAMKFETSMLGLRSFSWVDSTGRSIKELQEPGITMLLESQEKAMAGLSAAEQLDLLSCFAVKPDSNIANPRGLSELRIILKGKLPSDSLVFSSSTQKASYAKDGVHLLISIPNTTQLKQVSIPITEPKEFLIPSVYIQSEDAAIKKKAFEIIASEKDALTAGRLLTEWVYKNLNKRATASVPSAVEVLETLEGDCNEHAILLAALGRAVGIPTKINVGLVYLNGAFYYHAWNSFYLGDVWLPVDATFGQFPADPTHVQLNEGELDEQARVLSIVDKIKIDVISYK